MQASESQQVESLYDSPAGQLGPILFGGHLHWGYWDQDSADDDFAAAAERLAQIMVDKTEIKSDQRFIDLGCGVGQPAMKLAKEKGCYVDGITISGFQQQSATARALAEGMQDKLNFTQANALQVPRADQHFDGGWFFESIFHMGHRKALQEASRLLKPGAILTLTDLPTLPTTTDEFNAFVQEHIHSTFIDAQQYPALLAETGFELLGIDDITENVMPWLVPKLKETLTEHKQEIVDLLIEDVDKAIEDWIYLFEYMSENLGYIVVKARKL